MYRPDYNNMKLYKWEDKWIFQSINRHPVEIRPGVLNHFTTVFDSEEDARAFIDRELFLMENREWDWGMDEWELVEGW